MGNMILDLTEKQFITQREIIKKIREYRLNPFEIQIFVIIPKDEDFTSIIALKRKYPITIKYKEQEIGTVYYSYDISEEEIKESIEQIFKGVIENGR